METSMIPLHSSLRQTNIWATFSNENQKHFESLSKCFLCLIKESLVYLYMSIIWLCGIATEWWDITCKQAILRILFTNLWCWWEDWSHMHQQWAALMKTCGHSSYHGLTQTTNTSSMLTAPSYSAGSVLKCSLTIYHIENMCTDKWLTNKAIVKGPVNIIFMLMKLLLFSQSSFNYKHPFSGQNIRNNT